MKRPFPSKATRLWIALIVTVAYLMPLSLSTLTGLTHAVDHVGAFVAAEQQKAVAMGLTHKRNASNDRDAGMRMVSPPATLDAEPGSEVEHRHGGTVHSHSSTLGQALLASSDADGEYGEAVLALSLGLHVPGAPPAVALVSTRVAQPAGASRNDPSTLVASIHTPPPRA